MSSGFPAADAPLTDDTFDTCYSVLIKQIQQETPTPYAGGQSLPELKGLSVTEAMDPLNKWHTHAKDGALAKLPTVNGQQPWSYLEDVRDNLAHQDVADLQTINGTLTSNWKGSAKDNYADYLQKMSQLLTSYYDSDGHGNGGYVGQVGDLLKAAFTVEVAYKKDLLEAARAASTALDGLEHGSSSGHAGQYLLAIAGLALTGAGAVAAAAAVPGVVFTNAVLGSLVSGYSWQKIGQALTVDGGTPVEIMESLSSAVDKTVTNYQSAAKKIEDCMDTVLDELQHAATSLGSIGQVPDPTDPNTSFKLSAFFPDSANQNSTLQTKIDSPVQ